MNFVFFAVVLLFGLSIAAGRCKVSDLFVFKFNFIGLDCPNRENPWRESNGKATPCSMANSTKACPSGYACTTQAMCCPASEDNSTSSTATTLVTSRPTGSSPTNSTSKPGLPSQSDAVSAVSDEQACGVDGKPYKGTRV